MTGHPTLPHLIGRRDEVEFLNALLDEVRNGQSRVAVIQGGPGVGKTALLEHLRLQAFDFRVQGVAGVESEMELPYAGLHQLLTPFLKDVDQLPPPQHNAILTAFGISSGVAPDRFLVGLAALGLLSNAAGERPLCCLIDDAQWMDDASTETIAFVGRRLQADSVALVLATRRAGPNFRLFSQLEIEGLAEADARELLDSVLGTPLDARIRSRVLAEAQGNPLALLELFRGLTSSKIAGGFGLTDSLPVVSGLETEYLKRLEALPANTQTLLLVAAADPVGDPALVWQAATALGVDPAAAAAAVDAGLFEIDSSVHFRHPLVRSAIYRSATLQRRREAHRALADASDTSLDADRIAWHRAHATDGLNEDVAEELERSADRARGRGGLAAASAFLQKAFELTPDAAHRAERALVAAQAKVQSGALEDVDQLLAAAEVGPLTEESRAKVDLVRAQLAFASKRGAEAPLLMLNAAKRLENVDLDLAKATYLDALYAALHAGRLAVPEADVRTVAMVVTGLPLTQGPSSFDLLLQGLAESFTKGYAAGLPLIKRALQTYTGDMQPYEALRWLSFAYGTSAYVWDDAQRHWISTEWVSLVRKMGAVSEMPIALTAPIMSSVFEGELSAATAAVEELRAATEAAQCKPFHHGPMTLAAFRGIDPEATQLIQHAIADATDRGEGYVISSAEWAHSVLRNGQGRYADALSAAQRVCEDDAALGFFSYGLIELIEAATHCGLPDLASDAYNQLSEMTQEAKTNWSLGVEARSHALVAEANEAEDHYRTAISLLGETRIRTEVARTHLLYGEWLRRKNRRADARQQLRTAFEMLTSMGMMAFAERARLELLATGERVRKRHTETTRDLTPQEASVARLAADGFTNPEIGSRLLISPRTVQYHLAKVFQKLDVSSRNQLHLAMPMTLSD